MEQELQFMAEVKSRFLECNQLERYDQFRCALDAFKRRLICTADVEESAKIVFQGHGDLYEKFTNFLPEGFKRIHSQELEENRCKQLKALIIDFFFEVQNRLGSQAYESFLNNFNRWKENPVEVYEKIYDIFHGHADLVHKFEEEFLFQQNNDVVELKEKREFIMSDRMERLDVSLSRVITTEKHVEGILEGREDCVNREFNQVECDCIMSLYSDDECDVMSLLRNRRQEILPLILKRLKKENEKLRETRRATYEFCADLQRLRTKSTLSWSAKKIWQKTSSIF